MNKIVQFIKDFFFNSNNPLVNGAGLEQPSEIDDGVVGENRTSDVDRVEVEMPFSGPMYVQPPEIHYGLDFGTSYTKGCYYFLDKDIRRIVNWNAAWMPIGYSEENSCLLPTVVWLDGENRLYMKQPDTRVGKAIHYLKMVLAGQPIEDMIVPTDLRLSNCAYKLYCAFFLANVFGWIEQSTEREMRNVLKGSNVSWSCNVGIPISYFDSPRRNTFSEVIKAGHYMQDRIGDSESLVYLDQLYSQSLLEKEDPNFLTEPEIYAESLGMFSDLHTPEGYYGVFDVGGGTVDGAVLRYARKDGEPFVNFLTSSVLPLGVEIIERRKADERAIRELRLQMQRETASLIMSAKRKAYDEWLRDGSLPVKMCGGGYQSEWHRSAIFDTYHEFQHARCGIPPYKLENLDFQISDVDNLSPSIAHRMFIAIGLSFPDGYGPQIDGFPHSNPEPARAVQQQMYDSDDLQRELYGDD